ncbi:hypothetical protein BC833DRAFT_601551 [Globomyces pollinis-pini]|nr:hypothetical protein BC833DRAFT_601551 [Globomyces pollinis-pini]
MSELVQSVIQAMMVGDLALSGLKLASVTAKNNNRIRSLILTSLFTLCLSQVLSSLAPAFDVYYAYMMNMAGSYLQLIGIILVVYLLYIRTSTIHQIDRKLQYFSWSIGSVMIVLLVVVRVVNTVNDTNKFNGEAGYFSNNVRQVLRVGLNVWSAIAILYFETYTTRRITQITMSKLDQSTYMYGMSLSVLISGIFVTQSVLQLIRVFYSTFTFAPFFAMGWSLSLKRIVEFKEELMRSSENKTTTSHTISSYKV